MGEEADGEAEPVLVTRGVEEGTPEEPTGVEPVGAGVGSTGVSVGSPAEVVVSVGSAAEVVVSVGSPAAVVVSVGSAAVVVGSAGAVSMGGIEMGWPADLHWSVTALETAGSVLVGVLWL
jgi:hypothetical protein